MKLLGAVKDLLTVRHRVEVGKTVMPTLLTAAGVMVLVLLVLVVIRGATS